MDWVCARMAGRPQHLPLAVTGRACCADWACRGTPLTFAERHSKRVCCLGKCQAAADEGSAAERTSGTQHGGSTHVAGRHQRPGAGSWRSACALAEAEQACCCIQAIQPQQRTAVLLPPLAAPRQETSLCGRWEHTRPLTQSQSPCACRKTRRHPSSNPPAHTRAEEQYCQPPLIGTSCWS